MKTLHPSHYLCSSIISSLPLHCSPYISRANYYLCLLFVAAVNNSSLNSCLLLIWKHMQGQSQHFTYITHQKSLLLSHFIVSHNKLLLWVCFVFIFFWHTPLRTDRLMDQSGNILIWDNFRNGTQIVMIYLPTRLTSTFLLTDGLRLSVKTADWRGRLNRTILDCRESTEMKSSISLLEGT